MLTSCVLQAGSENAPSGEYAHWETSQSTCASPSSSTRASSRSTSPPTACCRWRAASRRRSRCSPSRPRRARCMLANGLRVIADHGIRRLPAVRRADRHRRSGLDGAVRERRDARSSSAARARERVVAGVCTGGMILAAAGVLDGCKATTKREIAGAEVPPVQLMRERHPRIDVIGGGEPRRLRPRSSPAAASRSASTRRCTCSRVCWATMSRTRPRASWNTLAHGEQTERRCPSSCSDAALKRANRRTGRSATT